MNPYLIIALMVGWGASLAGSFWFGMDYKEGQQAEKQLLLKEAAQAWSDDLGVQIEAGFAGLRVTNTTINNEVRHEREIQTRVLDNPDCISPASVVRLLNKQRGYGESAQQSAGEVPADGRTEKPASPR